MADKKDKKKQVKIPIRILAQSEPLDFKDALIEEELNEKKSVKPASTKSTSKKTRTKKFKKVKPDQSSLEQKKKKALTWMIVIMAVIIAGWLVFIKGVFSNTVINTSSVKGAGDQLTNAFQDFNRIYSNIQKVNEIESSKNEQIEEFEGRIFPQFEENQ